MVCETKIVAAEDHEALPGAKKDALLAAAGAMWPPLPAAPPPEPQPLGGAEDAGPPEGRGVYIREFRAAEQEAARRIFYDGIMERIPNTAFRGLRQHPRTQLLYALLAGQCAGTCRSPCPPGPSGTQAQGPTRPPPAQDAAREGSGHAPSRLLALRWPGALASRGGAGWAPGQGAPGGGVGTRAGRGRRAGVSTCVPASPCRPSRWGRRRQVAPRPRLRAGRV